MFQVAIHVEPFKDRDHLSMRTQLQYLIDTYGHHPAFYRTSHGDKHSVPLIYIYDSYLVGASQWAEILDKHGEHTVRGTDIDAIFIGLLVEGKHQNEILKAGFDGFYTYFATNGFTFGSSWKNWPIISQWAKSNNLMFIPSVGPGYIDTEVRPWNRVNTRSRAGGKYYKESIEKAINTGCKVISITSFNEWHEGTQIEPAVAKTIPSRKYEDYGPHGPLFYLDLTKQLMKKLS